MGNVGKKIEIKGLGLLVKGARNGLKQKAFADSINLSLRTLGEIERKSIISPHSWKKLIEKYPQIATSQTLADSIHIADGDQTFEQLMKLANLNLSHEIKSYSLQERSETEVRTLLAEVNGAIMATYLQGGNPMICYNTAINWLEAAQNSEGAQSYESGILNLNLGYLLIQSDYDAQQVQKALSHFDNAINLLTKVPVLTPEGWKHLLRAYWLRAVSLKMQGGPDVALRQLDGALSDKSLIQRSTPASRAPLERQRTLILQSKKEFTKLEAGIKNYGPDSIEVFHTNRRLWEFALNDRNKSAASRFSAQTSDVYRRVKRHIEPVYNIAFYRAKLYQFLLEENITSAERLKNQLAQKCESLQLYGQMRQILSLWEASQKAHHGGVKLKNEVFPKS